MPCSGRQASHREPRYFQPSVTRLPFLSVLLICTTFLVGLTEIAIRRLPELDSNNIIIEKFHHDTREVNLHHVKLSRHILPRNPAGEYL